MDLLTELLHGWLQSPDVEAITSNGRTVSDILIKMLSVHAATTIAVGHATSLKRMPEVERNRSVLGFWVCPMYPVAEFIINTWRSLRVALRTRNQAGCAYHLAACLGTRAVLSNGDEEESLPLLELDPDSRLLHKRSQARDWRWWARMAVLIAFLVQDLSVMMLYARRIRQRINFSMDSLTTISATYLSGSFFNWEDATDAEFDNINFQFALGGFLAGLSSFLLMLLNYNWTYSPLGAQASGDIESEVLSPRIFSSSASTSLYVSSILTTLFQWRHVSESYQQTFDLQGRNMATQQAASMKFSFSLSALSLSLIAVSPFVRWLDLDELNFGLTGCCLILLRIASIIQAYCDLSAVHACSRSRLECIPAFAWRDPKEGLLWAL